jgi:hypothetical protein
MNIDSSQNLIDMGDIFELLSQDVIISDRNIFDFSIETVCGDRLIVVWSEYYPERHEQVSIYSCLYDKGKCQKPAIAYEGYCVDPNIGITAGKDCKVHLLLARSNGAKTELLLKTHNGVAWSPQTRIVDIESATFGHRIVASRKAAKFYVILGHYREWHTFPYILTAIFTGHTGKAFGKLFLIYGDGMSWSEPRRITKPGRFSASNPSICLNDELDTLHIVWEDERSGYWNKTIYYDSFGGNDLSGNKKISGRIRRASMPAIACDSRDNIYVAWSTFDKDDSFRLYFRERLNNSWCPIVELPGSGIVNTVVADTLGSVHLVWGDGSQIYYKIRTRSSWTKTAAFLGNRAKIFIDQENCVHLILVVRKDQQKDTLLYNKLQSSKSPA